MANESSVEQKFEAKIGSSGAILLAVGSVTGSGIYVMLGPVSRYTGPSIILAFAIDLVIAFLIACAYSECASVYPSTGGGFIFIKKAFGDKALYIGWIIWLSNMAYAAINAISVGFFMADLFGLGSEFFIITIGILAIILFTFFNIRGSDTLAKIQNPLVISLLVTLVIGAIFLFRSPPNGGFTPFMPYGFFSMMAGSALLMDLFIGFEDLASISEEVKNPSRNIPRAMLWCLVICSVFFFLVVIAVYYSMPLEAIIGSDLAFLDAVRSNTTIYFVVFLGAIFSLLTTVGFAVMAASRNLYALAKADFIDRKWSEIDPKHNTPTKAVLLTMFLTILILISGQVEFIASISNVSYVFTVAFVALTVIKFRKTETYTKDTFKTPFHPHSAYLTIILCFILIVFIEVASILVTLAWFFIGLLIYMFFSSKNRVIGTFFLVFSFFILISNVFAGLLIIIGGIVIYLFKIANLYSKVLILAGLKLFLAIILAGLYLTTEPTEGLSLFLFRAIPIFIFALLINILFDVIPVQEIVSYYIKKSSKRNIPIQFGDQFIIVLSDRIKKFIRIFNKTFTMLLFIISILLGIIGIVFSFDLLVWFPKTDFSEILSSYVFQFLWIAFLWMSSIVFSISAALGLFYNKK